MRVCVVVENHPQAIMGGAQYQAHLIAQELAARQGVSVTYLARRVPAPDAAQLGYATRQVGNSHGWRRKALFMDGASLRQALEEIRPDAIYQRMKQSYTAFCAAYARRHGIPFTLHLASDADVDPHWVRGRWLSSSIALDTAEAIYGNWGLQRATRIVAQTHRQANALVSAFGRTVTQVIGNFQSLPAQLPAKAPSPFRVIWVANFKEVKRPEIFLALATALRHRRDLEFIMIGRESPRPRFQRLEAKIRACGNLTRVGEMPIEQVNEVFKNAHFLVNTSLYEGFSNTFIQAWANGTIVTTLGVDVDGGLDALGIGHASADLEDLAKWITQVADAPDVRAQMAARAFRHVHAAHSLENARILGDLICSA